MKNFREHCPGIWRGSRPESIDDLVGLKARGVQAIFNLQSDFFELFQVNDERFWASDASILFIHNSMSMVFPPSRSKLMRVISQIAEALKTGPIYIHCHDGVDRTGITLFVYDVLVRHMSHKTAVKTLIGDGFHTWRYWWWIPFIENSIVSELLARIE